MKGLEIGASNHDGSVFNWLEAYEAGYEFVWVKATQGVHYLNPYVIADCRDACLNNLLVGVYHYYDPRSGTRERQRKHFERNGIAQVEQYCKLKPLYDCEVFFSVTTIVRPVDTLVIPGLGEYACRTYELKGSINDLAIGPTRADAGTDRGTFTPGGAQ